MGGGYRKQAFGEFIDDESASCITKRDFKSATDLIVKTEDCQETAPCLTKQLSEQSGQDLGQSGALVTGAALSFVPSAYTRGFGQTGLDDISPTLKKEYNDNSTHIIQ